MADSANTTASHLSALIVVNGTGDQRTSEYVSAVVSLLLATVGSIVNIYAAYHLVSTMRLERAHGEFPKFLVLKLNLTVSDLLLLLVHLPGNSIWYLTMQWYGGDFLCKLFSFMNGFIFYSSSNLIAIIAIDRLHSVSKLTRSSTHVNTRLIFMIATAWILATLCALPQWYVWRITPLNMSGHDMYQCVSVFPLIRFRMGRRLTKLVDELTYEAFHMACAFWLPGAVITVCYARLYLRLRRRVQNATQRSIPSLRVEFDVSTTHHENPEPLLKRTFSRMKRKGADGAGTSDHGNSNGAVSPATHRDPLEGISLEQTGRGHRCHIARVSRSTKRQTFAIITAYLVSWLPYNIVTVWGSFYPKSMGPYTKYTGWLKHLIALNAVLHPLLYKIREPPMSTRNSRAHIY